MISIRDHVIERIKSGLSFDGVSVKPAYSVSRISTPLVTVDESASNEGVYIDNQPMIVPVRISIECYAKQGKYNGYTLSAEDAAKALASEVDSIMNIEFGMSMLGESTVAPYTSDTTVKRVVSRYSGYLDTRTNLIYRRVSI